MKVATVKVYKGKEIVVCNKTDVKIWNENGYFTSSQQKKAAEDAKALKAAEKNGQSEDITDTTEITDDVTQESGEDETSETIEGVPESQNEQDQV